MDIVPTLFSAGWASGVNAYLTVAMLGLLGRAGVGDVPDELQSDPALVASLVMFAIEFVTDKVPYLDSVWDVIHTAVRPAIGGVVGALFGAEADLHGVDEALAAGGSGATALLSHGVKAGLRLGINASPEPVSNIIASITEDGLVALVVALSLENPEVAAAIAAVLLVAGVALVIYLAKRIRAAMRRLIEGRRSPPRADGL